MRTIAKGEGRVNVLTSNVTTHWMESYQQAQPGQQQPAARMKLY
jgi:hypothetical protein